MQGEIKWSLCDLYIITQIKNTKKKTTKNLHELVNEPKKITQYKVGIPTEFLYTSEKNEKGV